MKRTLIRLTAPALVLLAGLPIGAAQAATSSSTVSGVVGTELSVSVTTPPSPMTLTHATPGTATAVLAVTSTTGWTLTVHDASQTTPGKLDKVNCATRASAGGSLTNALAWADSNASTSGSLSGTPATVATGTGISTQTVAFTQTLDSSDAVSAADCYEATVTWTVS